jgi:flavorubredoxin
MYGHTEQMAEAIATALVEGGLRNVVLHNVSKTHASYILRDIFKYKGLIIGSPTYSNQLFPEIESLLSKIEVREVKGRIYGCFGSFTWAGAAVKRLTAFGEKMKWQMPAPAVEQKQAGSDSTYQACLALGYAMAASIQKI